eukprot:TRINITY_DN28656_c0_g1_i1.p1 TRINITY_DN28656_c0_g1~~TRINITY_DN28656_c0_g1_i1.p1  ORF type:complete len:763 (-),score=121.89 TRINITY_DN28656_c0_g1_i1:45-2333(-)
MPPAHELTEASIEIDGRGDAGKLVGRFGKTKHRIRRATGCDLDIGDESNRVLLRGKEDQVRVCKVVVNCTLQPRENIVVDPEDIARDCTTVDIPTETCRMVLGKDGHNLHSFEEEAGTIMFFGKVKGRDVDPDKTTCLIFGSRHGRRLFQLMVMGLVESVIPRTFTDAWYDKRAIWEMKCDKNTMDDDGEWGTEVRECDNSELAYIIGKGAGTRKKLMYASGCVVCAIGMLLYISGTKEQRQRANEYIGWLLQGIGGREGGLVNVDIEGSEERDDLTLVAVPEATAGYVTGSKRSTLNELENKWGVMVFPVQEKFNEDCQTYGIFGSIRGRTAVELTVKGLVEHRNPGYFADKLAPRESGLDVFDVDYIELDDKSIAYVCGQKHLTLKKLARASGALMEMIGGLCAIAGEKDQRSRCRDFVHWLLSSMDGSSPRIDSKGRDDILELSLSEKDFAAVGSTVKLRDIEQQSETFILRGRDSSDEEHIYICGQHGGSTSSPTGCEAAEQLLLDALSNPDSWHARSSYGGDYKRPRTGEAEGTWVWKRDDDWDSRGRKGSSNERKGKGGSGKGDDRWPQERSFERFQDRRDDKPWQDRRDRVLDQPWHNKTDDKWKGASKDWDDRRSGGRDDRDWKRRDEDWKSDWKSSSSSDWKSSSRQDRSSYDDAPSRHPRSSYDDAPPRHHREDRQWESRPRDSWRDEPQRDDFRDRDTRGARPTQQQMSQPWGRPSGQPDGRGRFRSRSPLRRPQSEPASIGTGKTPPWRK